jgi:hypothetical protein
VKKTVRPPNPAPSLLRFSGTLAVTAILVLAIGAALYERLFVIEPGFAAVTAPEISICADRRRTGPSRVRSRRQRRA